MSFRRDPLVFIDAAFAGGQAAAWLPGRQLCVADAEVGRRILWNREGLFQNTTDFFGTPEGPLQPREAQIAVGGAAREALAARLGGVDVAGAMARLPDSTQWPAAGNRLLFDLLEPLFAGPHRPEAFRALIAEVAGTRIFRTRPPWWDLRAAGLRERLMTQIRIELARSPQEAGGTGDLLDLLAGVAPDNSAGQVMSVYVSLLFAMVGSVGFALGWSIWLTGRNRTFDEEASHLVLEGLRLYPVAWLLGRKPAVGHEILGHPVSPRDSVVVCPYAIHRNPAWWEEPRAFRPARWRDKRDRLAWMPFGAGPHSCVAVSLTLDLVTRMLTALLEDGDWTVRPIDDRPGFGPALRPPRFQLEARPRRRSVQSRAG